MEEIKEGYTRISEIIRARDYMIGESPFEKIPPHILENKKRIGTNVHAKIAGEFDDIFLPLETDESPYYESWRKWLETHELLQCVSEQRLYCDNLKITGCLDLIEKVGLHYLVIDFKTTAQMHHKSWALQGAFYAYLLRVNGFEPSDRVLFLQLQKDGSEAKELSIKLSDELWQKCLDCLSIYRYFND